MNYLNGHEFEYKFIRPSQICADPLYQRKIDPRRVEKIVNNFDGDIFNEPKVSFRDGKYWVFDGQHSKVAYVKVHKGEDKPIYCKVFKGMTWLDEAEAFRKQNGFDKDPTTTEDLWAAYNARVPEIVDMVEKARLCGFTVDFVDSKTPTRIVALGALHRAYRLLGGDDFLDMMTAIKEAWYGDMDAISAQIITAVSVFYKTYKGNFDRASLVNSLKRISPAEILRQGRTYRNRKNTYAHEIVKQYNFKRKYRLDENKL